MLIYIQEIRLFSLLRMRVAFLHSTSIDKNTVQQVYVPVYSFCSYEIFAAEIFAAVSAWVPYQQIQNTLV